MSFFCFCGRREDRFCQLTAFLQSRRQCNTAHGATLLVFLPSRPCQITAYHAFIGNDLGLADDHAASEQRLRNIGRQRQSAQIRCQKMIFDRKTVKPELTDSCQQLAFSRDARRQDIVKRANTICGHEQQLVAKVIDVAHLSMFYGNIRDTAVKHDWRHFWCWAQERGKTDIRWNKAPDSREAVRCRPIVKCNFRDVVEQRPCITLHWVKTEKSVSYTSSSLAAISNLQSPGFLSCRRGSVLSRKATRPEHGTYSI